jgi:hypothetical protein
VAPRRDLVNLVETAARANKVADVGFRGVEALDARIRKHHADKGE